VRAIAEWLILRLAAAAEGDGRLVRRNGESVARGIDNGDRPFDEQGAVIANLDRDLRHHGFLERPKPGAHATYRRMSLRLRLPVVGWACVHRQTLVSTAPPAATSKSLFKPVPAVADVPRVHRVAPADFFDWNAEGGGDALAFIGAGRPAPFRDRGDALHRELRSFGNFVDRYSRLLKKMFNGAYGHDQVSRDECPFQNSMINNMFSGVKSSSGGCRMGGDAAR
jgi:hypothetical protein